MVDWSRIHDAYGPAAGTGDLLQRLATGDAQAQKEALDGLHGRIAHQGSVYEASLAAVPPLLQAVPKVSGLNREFLLALLATLALSEDCHDVGHEALRQAVARGIEAYLDLLNSETARDREGASLLLALCEDQAAELSPILRFKLRMETDERAQAGFLLALARLGGRESLELLTAAFRAHEGLVRLAAALGAHHVAPVELPVDLRGFLLRMSVNPMPSESQWATSFWYPFPELLPGPELIAGSQDPDELDRSLVALFDALPYADGETALSILETLIWSEFPQSTVAMSPAALMPGERDVLQALLDSPHAWPLPEKMERVLGQRGLPLTREALEALLC